MWQFWYILHILSQNCNRLNIQLKIKPHGKQLEHLWLRHIQKHDVIESELNTNCTTIQRPCNQLTFVRMHTCKTTKRSLIPITNIIPERPDGCESRDRLIAPSYGLVYCEHVSWNPQYLGDPPRGFSLGWSNTAVTRARPHPHEPAMWALNTEIWACWLPPDVHVLVLLHWCSARAKT